MTTYDDGWTDVRPKPGQAFWYHCGGDARVYFCAGVFMPDASADTLYKPACTPPPPRRKTAVDELEEALARYRDDRPTVSYHSEGSYRECISVKVLDGLERAADRVIREHREGKRA